jgi:pantetheine-phosphate adenylyltransferase
MSNSTKKSSLFTIDERIGLINRCVKSENVKVDTHEGLLVDYAEKVGAIAIVKGLRAMSDFDYEFQQALTNKSLNQKIETVFLTASGQNMFLSSSMVKEVCALGGDISSFVPECITEDINNRCKGDNKND